MSGRRSLWCLLVFLLTLLGQWPARWVSEPLGLPMAGVSGSLWQGEAHRAGPLDQLRWHWQPWRLRAEASAGIQGQRWNLALHGWPWDWHLQVQPTLQRVAGRQALRLDGQWHGSLLLHGSGAHCRRAEQRVTNEHLALLAPWQLPLGRAEVRLDCTAGSKLVAQLQLPGQHHADLVADLVARQATLQGQVEATAALHPLLVSLQWLQPGSTRLAREMRW